MTWILPLLIAALLGHTTAPSLVAAPQGWPYRRPRIAHFMPYLVGDSLSSWKRARRLRIRHKDQNAQCTRDNHAVGVHWSAMAKNGYKYRATGEHYRLPGGRMVEKRVKVPGRLRVEEHDLAAVLTFRTARIGGRRPHTIREHMVAAVEQNRIMCLEVKGAPGFKHDEVWDRLAADAAATGVVLVVMTLTSIPGWWDRCQQAHRVELAVAILPRMAKPPWWDQPGWRPQVWGRWRPAALAGAAA